MRVQSIIKKYAAQGYSTVIVGDKGHAEVIGLLGYAEGKGHVVQELDEIEQLPPMERCALLPKQHKIDACSKKLSIGLKNAIQTVNLLKRSAVQLTNDRMKSSASVKLLMP